METTKRIVACCCLVWHDRHISLCEKNREGFSISSLPVSYQFPTSLLALQRRFWFLRCGLGVELDDNVPWLVTSGHERRRVDPEVIRVAAEPGFFAILVYRDFKHKDVETNSVFHIFFLEIEHD